MSNSFYNHSLFPTPNAPGSSAQMRNELDLISAAFNKLPTLSGNGYKVAMINAAGTALVASSALQSLAITGSTIDSTPIGATTPSTGAFTTLSAVGGITANVTGNLTGNVTGNVTGNLTGNVTSSGSSSFASIIVSGGTLNSVVIGNTSANAITGTLITANTGFAGNLTGNVTGNVTGNLTGNVTGNVVGNVTGNLTGNVTAGSGTSTFNNVTINGTLDMDAASSATIINLPAPVNSGDAANKGYVDTGLALKLNLAGGTMSGNIAMGGSLVTGLAAPSAGGDATNKTYVDAQDALKLSLAGGTMSGAIAMGSNKVTGLGTPTNTADATTKAYVDAADALKLNLAGGTMSGAIAMGNSKITGLADPTNPQDAATKNYVDSVAQGLDVKPSVRVATTANITLSGTQSIDGVSVIAGDRVLVKDQSTASQNGIYVVAAGAWSRSTDADAWAELPGGFFFVEEGTSNDNSGWVCTVSAGGTLGTTAITFEQFSGAGQITAGNGLTKTGNTLDVVTASSARIVVNSDSIDLATTGVAASTYRSVTVDAYGRVTAGTNPTTLGGYGITDAYTTSQIDTALALKLNLSGGTMSGAIAMGANKITGLGDPTFAQDAATKTYVDTVDALKLNLSGGTMSGAIAMGTNKITGLGDPTSAQDAATKTYVDTVDALKLNLAGGTMSGAIAMGTYRITGLGDPVGDQDAVTKAYVTALYGVTAAASVSAAAAAVSETNAAASASSASGSAISATSSASSALSSANAAAASYDSFDDRYLGAKSSPPSVDNDGNALITGALYFDSTANEMRVWTGSVWKATGSAVNGTSARATYTATAGQTTFGITYDVGFVDVYLNGLKLQAGVDFTATSGVSVVLAAGATVGDIIDIVAYGAFSVANTYTQAQVDLLIANATDDGTY